MSNKRIIILVTSLLFLIVSCKNRSSEMRKITVEEVSRIRKLAPKKDTIYVDSVGHTWYVYPKPDGMIVILEEEDTTERQKVSVP